MGKTNLGGISVLELVEIVGGFLVNLRQEYEDDHKLTAAEVLGCFSDLFSEIYEAADDTTIKTIADSVGRLLDAIIDILNKE